MNQQISLGGRPVVGFNVGVGVTLDQLTEEEKETNRRKNRVIQAVFPAGVALAGSGVGALVGSVFNRPTGGAIAGGAISNGLFGLFAAGFGGVSGAGAIPMVLVPVGIALAGGAIGSAIGKPNHPTAGAIVGAATANTLVAGAAVLLKKPFQQTWRRVGPDEMIQIGQRVAVAVRSPTQQDIAELNDEIVRAGNKSATVDAAAWPPGYKPPSDRWPPDDTFGSDVYRFAFNAPQAGRASDLAGSKSAVIWVRNA